MSETEQATPVRRPWHLWVIGIIGFLWNAMGCLDYVMTETQNEGWMAQFTPEQLEFFYGLPTWVVACWAIAVWGGLAGCVLLLLRKSLALWAFAASLLGSVLTTIHNFGMSNGLEVMGAAGAVFGAIIQLIAVGLLLYAWQTTRRGVLA
jgi:hypothetical protein